MANALPAIITDPISWNKSDAKKKKKFMFFTNIADDARELKKNTEARSVANILEGEKITHYVK